MFTQLCQHQARIRDILLFRIIRVGKGYTARKHMQSGTKRPFRLKTESRKDEILK